MQQPVEYRQNNLNEAQQELANYGITEAVRQALIDFFERWATRNGVYAAARTAEAVTPTTFEQFVKNKLRSKP